MIAIVKSPRKPPHFKHQGCPGFEPEAHLEPAKASNSLQTEMRSGGQAKPLKIHLSDFQMVFEDFAGGGGMIAGYFLDTHTGEVIPLSRDAADYDELNHQIDAGLGFRYRRLEPLQGRESFRIMEQFAHACAAPLKNRLLEALGARKPFRAFKDVVHSNVATRGQWFQLRDQAYAEMARKWLESEGIQAEIVLPKRNIGVGPSHTRGPLKVYWRPSRKTKTRKTCRRISSLLASFEQLRASKGQRLYEASLSLAL